MLTRTYKYTIPTGDISISSSTGKQLNLDSDFTIDGSKDKIGKIISVKCEFPIYANSRRNDATIQTTFSNASTNTIYNSNVITTTLSSSNSYVANINNTWETLPPASFFNDAAKTTISIKHTNYDPNTVREIYLRRHNDSAVTITIKYETGSQSYVYYNGEWKLATPYIFNGTTWVPATINIYNNGWS